MSAPTDFGVLHVKTASVVRWTAPIAPNRKLLGYEFRLEQIDLDAPVDWQATNTRQAGMVLVDLISGERYRMRVRGVFDDLDTVEETGWIEFTFPGRRSTRKTHSGRTRTLSWKSIVNSLERRKVAYPVYWFGGGRVRKFERPGHNPFKDLVIDE